MGQIGLEIALDSGALAHYANVRLQGEILMRSPDISPQALSAEVNQIGVQLMDAQVATVDQFGSPSASQIADYHFAVFAAHGLPRSTFGGAMFTGTQAEANATSRIWMNCR
jgi:hypothetical protein